mgnify:CR=1 FL=1
MLVLVCSETFISPTTPEFWKGAFHVCEFNGLLILGSMYEAIINTLLSERSYEPTPLYPFIIILMACDCVLPCITKVVWLLAVVKLAKNIISN